MLTKTHKMTLKLVFSALLTIHVTRIFASTNLLETDAKNIPLLISYVLLIPLFSSDNI